MLHNYLFEVNYRTLAIQLMPTKWRKPIHIGFVKVLIYPFVLILNELKASRKENIYRLQHDARVGIMQKMLNDKFDTVDRRIFIFDGQRKDPIYIYTPQENRPKYAPFWIYTPQTIAAETADFEVHVPQAVGLPNSELQRMERLVRYYADKDKTFTIKII